MVLAIYCVILSTDKIIPTISHCSFPYICIVLEVTVFFSILNTKKIYNRISRRGRWIVSPNIYAYNYDCDVSNRVPKVGF